MDVLTTLDLARLGLLPGPETDPRPVPIPALGGCPEAWLAPGVGEGRHSLKFMTPIPEVVLSRRPFRRSPGRWWLLCPVCGRHRDALLLDPANPENLTARGPRKRRWACWRCRGLAPPSQRLSKAQKARNAATRAGTAGTRRAGETRAAWELRQAKAARVLAAEAERLDRVRAQAEQALAAFDD